MTLDELKATAPRTFDKTLVDLLVAIQQGHTPIVTSEPAQPRDLSPALVRVAEEVSRLQAELAVERERCKRIETVIARLVMEATAAE